MNMINNNIRRKIQVRTDDEFKTYEDHDKRYQANMEKEHFGTEIDFTNM